MDGIDRSEGRARQARQADADGGAVFTEEVLGGEAAKDGEVDEHHREGDPEARAAVFLPKNLLRVVLGRALDDGFFDRVQRIGEEEDHGGKE